MVSRSLTLFSVLKTLDTDEHRLVACQAPAWHRIWLGTISISRGVQQQASSTAPSTSGSTFGTSGATSTTNDG